MALAYSHLSNKVWWVTGAKRINETTLGGGKKQTLAADSLPTIEARFEARRKAGLNPDETPFQED